MLSLRIRKKIIYTLSTLIQHITENLVAQHAKRGGGSGEKWGRKEKGGVEGGEKKRLQEHNNPGQKGRSKTTTSISRLHDPVYRKTLRNPLKLLELASECNKTAKYKINIQKSIVIL